MGDDSDLVDWAAAALFGIAGIGLGVWSIWLMLSLVRLPLGLVTLVVGILSWYAAKGVFSRDREAWWAGILVTLLGLALWIPEVLFSARLGRVPPWEDLTITAIALLLAAYLIVGRARYGIGRRLPATMTIGYPAEKAK